MDDRTRVELWISIDAENDLRARLKTLTEDNSVRRLVEATLNALISDLPAEVRSRREDL